MAMPQTLPALPKRHGHHNYEHIFEWLRAGVSSLIKTMRA